MIVSKEVFHGFLAAHPRMVGSTLDLRAAVWKSSGASLSMEQDPSLLRLKFAGAWNTGEHTEIFWTLEGLKPGETEVKIIASGGLMPITTVRRVKVVIEPPPNKK